MRIGKSSTFRQIANSHVKRWRKHNCALLDPTRQLRSNAVSLSPYAENDMDLTWLADFVALSESGSFSRAAAQRHITQPAFSRRI